MNLETTLLLPIQFLCLRFKFCRELRLLILTLAGDGEQRFSDIERTLRRNLTFARVFTQSRSPPDVVF